MYNSSFTNEDTQVNQNEHDCHNMCCKSIFGKFFICLVIIIIIVVFTYLF